LLAKSPAKCGVFFRGAKKNLGSFYDWKQLHSLNDGWSLA
jgi:hypothetical protein